jgi:hypothetical protein
LRSEMNHQFDDLKETLHNSRTELLKAFQSFTETNQQSFVPREGNQADLITRVSVLEERMLQLEQRINFPGHP